jgi:hypothetical protein
MARIAIGLAGGIIGGIVGGALGNPLMGAELGFSLGNIVGGLLFPPRLPTNYGPRLNDLQVMSSADGLPIPWGYGGFRVSGNVIYAQSIKETKNTQNASAKGGPSQASITYVYTCSFAVAFCEGPAQILRIWADSKLIYDNTNKTGVSLNTGVTSNGIAQTVSFLPTIYNGNNTQQPDPTIQADKGIANTPAFRGICYAMFTDFPLADFGNRLPNIRAELSNGSNLIYIKDAYPPANLLNHNGNIDSPGFTYVDSPRRLAYALDSEGQAVQKIDINVPTTLPLLPWQASFMYAVGNEILDANGDVQLVVSVTGDALSGAIQPTWQSEGNNTTDHHVTWRNIGAGPQAVTVIAKGVLDPRFGIWQDVIVWSEPNADGQGACVDTAGYLWGAAILNNTPAHGNVTAAFAVRYDPNTFMAAAIYEMDSIPLAFVPIEIGGTHYVYVVTVSGFLYRLALGNTPFQPTGFSFLPYLPAGAGWAGGNKVYFSVDPETGVVYLPFYFVNSSSGYWGWLAIDLRGAGTATQTIAFSGNTTTNGVGIAFLLDTADNSLLVFTGIAGFRTLYKVDIATGTILSHLGSLTSNTFFSGDHPFVVAQAYKGLIPGDGIVRLYDATGANVIYVSAGTMTISNTVPSNSWFPLVQPSGSYIPVSMAYDALSNSLLWIGDSTASAGDSLTYRIYLDRQAVASESLDNIISDLLQRADVDPSNIDVSGVSSINCLGYTVTRTSDAKSCLQPLLTAYFVDIVETDFKLKAVPRGQSVSVSVPEADLGISDDKYKLQETIAQEQDLPKLISVEYYDPALNYQQGKQSHYRRAKVKKTKNQSVIQLPIALSADDAAKIANKYLAMIWGERNQYDMKLWRSSYLTIDPSDVIQFTFEGKLFEARIAKHSIGQNLAMEISGVSEDARQYLSSVSGAGNVGFNSGAITSVGPTILFLLDVPLLQDTDASSLGNSGMYWAMSSPVGFSNWPGGALFSSTDDLAYTQIASDLISTPYGTVATAVASPLFSPYSWDMVTQITVRMSSGALSSTSMLNVLNGANACIIGGEIIQFANATLNADGTYTLSTLLRGRRGTEYACKTHVAGETFIALSAATLQHMALATSVINQLRYYKGVTIGNFPSDVSPQVQTLKGNDLKPYAPGSFTGTANPSTHDISITWIRRTRVGGAWLDGTGTVPLSEQSESYDLDIYNGTTVVRSVRGLSSPSYTYLAADQVTDFGGHQTSVKMIVYQNSASIGRGFATENDTVGTGSTANGAF